MVLGITFSPKMSRKLKALYMTKSHTLEELNKLVDEGGQTAKNQNPKLLLKSMDTLFDAAKKAYQDGDEERAYVLYMRFLQTSGVIQKSEEYKKDEGYYKKMMGLSRIKETYALCKTLSDALDVRYSTMQQANKIDLDLAKKEVNDAVNNEKAKKDAKDSQANKKPLTPGTNGIVKSKLEDEVAKDKILQESGVLTVKALKSLVDQKSTRFLAIDCRSKHDFNRGRIIHSNCISIPAEILSPGTSAFQLEKKLKELHPESYMSWVKRGTFDQIVLYDWNSSFENQQPTLKTLYTAMTQWDPETVYKSPPAVLQGGMKNLYFSYPTLITQPQNVSEDSKKVDAVESASAKNLDSISYPTWDDEPTINRSNSASPQIGKINNDVTSNGFSTNASSNNNGSSTPSTVNIDRSTKPKSSTSNMPNGLVRPKPSNENSKPGGMVNGTGSASNIKVDPTDSKREAINAALDDIIRISGEVSTGEENLSELQAKALSFSNDPTLVAKLKSTEDALAEKTKQLKIREDAFSILEQEYNAQLAQNRSKSTLPQIRQSEADAKIQARIKEKHEQNIYVEKIRADRKRKELEMKKIAAVVPIPRVNSSASTPFPTIKSETGAKPAASGGLLRPMSQDASPLTNLHKLKDDSSSESPRSSLLKRSHSHPNIAQSLSEDHDAGESVSNQIPSINRTLKPSVVRPKMPEIRTREFHAINSSEKTKTGLKNLGNTCYMNSIMQCINHLPGLVNYLMGEKFKEHLRRDRNPTKGDITLEVAAAIKEMNYGHRSIALNDFKTVVGRYYPSFRGGDQQDSHEFLTILLDCLHEELNRSVTKNPLKEQKNDNLSDEEASTIAWNDYTASNHSKISELFCGQQKSCVKCRSCGKESITFEPFFNLSVPIPNTNRKVDLMQCIDLYTTEEELAGWFCVHCKTKVKATKKIDLWKLPPYLIIHLQRFYSDGWWKKRLTEVDFPIDNLDLTSKVMSRHSSDSRVPRLNFQLNGVSNHYGSMEGGHYTASCRRQGSLWYKFDDQEVYPMNPRDVCNSAAYTLFYCNHLP